MMMSLESIKSRRIEGRHLSLVKKIRNLLRIKYNGVIKKLRNSIKGRCIIIGKREWLNAVIASGNSLISNYLSM